ncbi:MAG: hypothetical protein R2765_10400 [Ferruginibacter sp.]
MAGNIGQNMQIHAIILALDVINAFVMKHGGSFKVDRLCLSK